MSTLGPEQTLLTGTQGPASAGAAQTEPTKSPEGAAPAGTGQAQTVPLQALVGEQENTRKAREEVTRLRGALELSGAKFDEQGNIVALPQQAYQPPQQGYAPQVAQGYGPQTSGQPTAEQIAQFAPATFQTAQALGVDPVQYARSQAEIAAMVFGTGAAPISSGISDLLKRQYQTEDPDYAVYGSEVDAELNRLSPIDRAQPQRILDVVERARGRKMNELAEKRAERIIAQRQGKIVGQFVEGASPGQGGTATPTVKPEVVAYVRAMGLSPEHEQAMLQRLAQGGE